MVIDLVAMISAYLLSVDERISSTFTFVNKPFVCIVRTRSTFHCVTFPDYLFLLSQYELVPLEKKLSWFFVIFWFQAFVHVCTKIVSLTKNSIQTFVWPHIILSITITTMHRGCASLNFVFPWLFNYKILLETTSMDKLSFP